MGKYAAWAILLTVFAIAVEMVMIFPVLGVLLGEEIAVLISLLIIPTGLLFYVAIVLTVKK